MYLVRVVITGGAGFLGSHLADRILSEGHKVVIVDNFVTGSRRNVAHLQDNPGVLVLEQDCSTSLQIAGDVDYVAHFASPASPDDFKRIPLEVLRVGSHGTENCLNLCVTKGAKFIFASTSEVYGDPAISPQPESYWGNVNPIGPRSVYDEAKRFGEAITMAYHRHRGVDTRIIRFFNTYGPRMRLDDGRVVPNFVSQALRGESLTVYGDGSNTRSFGYYADAIDCVYRLMMSDVHEPVNIGSQEERTMMEFAHAVIKATGSASGISHLEAAVDDPKQRRPDTTRAKELLGWSPTTSLDEGLAATIEYFKTILSN
jgi:dTDP-glucose 4,6-dehydratase